ncbi:hypothetical protein ABGN05_13915 [Aquibium sp. LZ166]|uniref:Uncharacterized protein n=1 Tax=Aquibium pacificus TaxID=3153579 RepID=A0ABV3SL92_9HYPH
MISSRSSAELLLLLLESRELVYTHHSLVNHFRSAGKELLDARLLVALDYEAVVSDEVDGPVEVRPGNRPRELGYRDAAGAWTAVKQEELRRYRPDLKVFFQTLFGGDLHHSAGGPVELVPELSWDLGTARLGRRDPTEVWFVRRLSHEGAWSEISQAIQRRPATSLRLILTSTPGSKAKDRTAQMCCIVSLKDVLETDRLRLNVRTLGARLAGRAPEQVSSDVHLSGDNTLLIVAGNEIRFAGSKHKIAIRYMVDAHSRAKSFRAAEVADRAGSRGLSLDQIFGRVKWPLLRPHLHEVDGNWRFAV